MPVAAWLCEETIKSIPAPPGAHSDSISLWLSRAPSPPSSIESSRERSWKHFKQIPYNMSSRGLSPSKRRRHEGSGPATWATEDVENTPRQRTNIAIEPPSPPSYATNHTSRSSTSQRSGSPKKRQPLRKMANLSLLPNPVMMRSINDTTTAPPNELEVVILQLKRIGRGLGVISRSEKVCSPVVVMLNMLKDPALVGCNSVDVFGQVVSPDTYRRVRIR